MIQSIQNKAHLIGEALLKSYGQLFFSKHVGFASLLFLASFVDLKIGVSGLIAGLISIILALLLGYNEQIIRNGTYSYNSLMVGLALGIYYDISPSFMVILVIASIFCFFLNLWILGKTNARSLPLMSWSFIFIVWIVLYGGNNFSAFSLSARDFANISSDETLSFVANLNVYIAESGLPDFVLLYFKSLGAIMFQYNIVAGVLIFVGLLFFSRIATVLSIVGFFFGLLFYQQFEGDFHVLMFIGFNFILTSIALGGFFIVPSKKSFLLVAITIPIIAVLISGLHSFINTNFGLPLFSLPFCIVVTLVLTGLAYRERSLGLDFVTVQHFSPEKNHYKNYYHKEKFKTHTWIPIHLPILGEWYISQGYDGGITHKGEWGKALDFDIRDENDKTYRDPGVEVGDYYCYDLPVIAPAGGYIVEILDNIPDNKIGDANLENNWGNTLVIKHAEGLYSKLSHFKKGSFKVKVGDYVQKGDLLGTCGNSGRSPEPHLHFQVQTTPYIGSKTLAYPLAYYLKKDKNKLLFQSFSVPKEGEFVQNIQSTKLLKEAFKFIPGKSLRFEVESGNVKQEVKWEVYANALNQTYLYCTQSKSYAYFVNNGSVFYFTDFEGDKKSLLFKFYLSIQKTILGYYKGVEVEEQINTQDVMSWPIKVLQDFVAPFFHFSKAKVKVAFAKVDNEHYPEKLEMTSSIGLYLFGKKFKDFNSKIIINEEALSEIEFIEGGKVTIAKCI